MKMDMIPAKELDKYIGKNGYEIIDLREMEEYRKGHVKGARHIDYNNEGELLTLPRNKTYILYCDRGGASLITARFLQEHGYRVKPVSGGILSYRGVNFVDTEKGLS